MRLSLLHSSQFFRRIFLTRPRSDPHPATSPASQGRGVAKSLNA
jgi:hypothetical protein